MNFRNFAFNVQVVFPLQNPFAKNKECVSCTLLKQKPGL